MIALALVWLPEVVTLQVRSLHLIAVHMLFPACTRVYAFTARCTYVQRIGPTVDIAHYEYHYLSSAIRCMCGEPCDKHRNAGHCGASVSEEADTTALGTAAKSHSACFPTQQSNANKRRLDRERCLSHPVASLGESWNRDPVALSWRLRSLSLGVSVRDPALMKYYDRALKRRRR